jgi:hypothetical protein
LSIILKILLIKTKYSLLIQIMQQIKISAKELGELALPTFDPVAFG